MYSFDEDRVYFCEHTTDRLLEIAQEWIVSARGLMAVGQVHGVSGAQPMIARAQRLIELVLDRTRST